jgi:hypothetical protein
MTKRRYSFIVVLVVGFHLFYALSPLLYSAENAQPEAQLKAGSAAYRAGGKLFVSDRALFLAPVAEKEEDSSAPASRVLLKKKRALPASFKDMIRKLSSCQARFADSRPFMGIVIATVRVPCYSPRCSKGFTLYYSGASPPSA